ncbi:MAG TPA: type VI secretion system tube protein Hcp [Myxococcales bacterium]|nr:type VI secretion system tube protein Hcp [Myxococcales bacterium]
MALMAYLTLTGQKSGQIHGSITQAGREKSIGVIAVSHQIESPRDPQSGLPTGQRIELLNANIASYQLTQPNIREGDGAKRAPYEEFAFTYEQITWTWLDTGKVAHDNWAQR